MFWNSNGIKNHVNELIYYLALKKIHIACICETRLTNADKVKLRNYKIERVDRPNNRGGGVLILIENSINYKLLHQFQSPIEHVSIELESGIIITSVYAPPTRNFSLNDIEALFPYRKRTLILGDFNARSRLWNNRRQNRRGTVLADFVLARDDVQLLHTDTPTHYPSNGMTPTYIDLGLNYGLRDLTDPTTDNALSSDHLPIHLTWKSGRTKINNFIYSYKSLNWNLFRKNISQHINIRSDISTPMQIDNEVDRFISLIQRERDRLATKIPNSPQLDNLPQEIIDLIKFRNKIRKKWQRFRREVDKARITAVTFSIKQKIRAYRNECWTKTLSELSITDQSLWKMTRKLNKQREKLDVISYNGVDYLSDLGKAEAISTHMESVYSELPDTTTEQEHITETKNKFTLQTYPIPPRVMEKLLVNPKEIYDILKTFPNNKAPGPDGIPYRLLKNLPQKAIVQLMHIINSILRLQYFPMQFKRTLVIPIRKPGKDPSSPSSYRPISLLNTLSKVVERVILHRVRKIADQQKLIPKEQFGFRPGHNTTLLAAKIVTDVFQAYNKQMNTALLLLDMEKAFDTVWHAGLIYKLAVVHNLPLYFISLIHSYLENRSFQIKVETSLSNVKHIKSGVPQGSVLSPLLYILYVADFPKSPTTNLALYADDTAIYTSSFYAQAAKQRLAHHLTLISPYFAKWKLKMNPNKTELVVFTKKFTNQRIFNPLIVEGIPITQQKVAKYLGIKLDERLYFHDHVSFTLARTFSAQQKLYPLTCPKSPLSPYNKLLIYKLIIRPTLTYGAPVWCSISDTQRHRLQKFQNRILRGVLSADRYARISDLHDFTGIEYISDHINILSEKFYRCKIFGSPITRNLTQVRYDPDNITKHGPPYKKLSLYYEPWHPP